MTMRKGMQVSEVEQRKKKTLQKEIIDNEETGDKNRKLRYHKSLNPLWE